MDDFGDPAEAMALAERARVSGDREFSADIGDYDDWYLIPVDVHCPELAAEVIERRFRRVLSALIELRSAAALTDVSRVREVLPTAFVAVLNRGVAPDGSWEVEQARRNQLPMSQQLCVPMTLVPFLGWFARPYRPWYFWDAVVLSSQRLRLTVAVDETPFMEGALRSLALGCGAAGIEVAPA